jgi:hypothetical protein
MKRLAIIAVLVAAALAANPGAQELKRLILSAQAAGDNDNKIAYKVSHFRLKERLTDRAVADIRALNLGLRASAVLELIADNSEFEAAADASGTAPLTPSEADALLEKTRLFALNYIRSLPDFICTSIIRRFESNVIGVVDNEEFLQELRLQDTLMTEVSFAHGKEVYRASHAQDQSAQGLTTKGEFGSILGSILNDGTHPAWSRWESIDGKLVGVFHYSVDAAHSRYAVDWLDNKRRPRQNRPAFNGELSIDPASGTIVRLTRHAALPRDSRIFFVDTAIEYQPVLIGGVSYICPVKSITRSAWKADPAGFAFSLNEVQFGSYHKFEGESKLAFDQVK